MRPVHQQQMYQVFTHSTRSLISIMSAVFQCVQKYAITSSVLKCAFLATNSSLRLPDLRKSRSRGEGGRTRWNILYKNNPTFDNLSRFGCSVCGKHYSTSSNLARHRQAVLRFQDFDPIPCLLNIGQILAILWFLVGIMLYYVDLILQADSPLTRGQQSKKMSRVQQSKNIVQWKDLSIWCFFRCTFPCLLIPCTCERTALVTSVASVERSSQDRGCWKDTCGRTPEKSRTGVPSVKSPSPTSQTSELTFRLTRLQKWEHDSLFYSQTPP